MIRTCIDFPSSKALNFRPYRIFPWKHLHSWWISSSPGAAVCALRGCGCWDRDWPSMGAETVAIEIDEQFFLEHALMACIWSIRFDRVWSGLIGLIGLALPALTNWDATPNHGWNIAHMVLDCHLMCNYRKHHWWSTYPARNHGYMPKLIRKVPGLALCLVSDTLG